MIRILRLLFPEFQLLQLAVRGAVGFVHHSKHLTAEAASDISGTPQYSPKRNPDNARGAADARILDR
jgi:hypothetical protein